MDNFDAYLNFSVTEHTVFSFFDTDLDLRRTIEFDPLEPQECIKAVASLIQKYGITKVYCNKIGYGLCGSISQYLKTNYSNDTCFFELND